MEIAAASPQAAQAPPAQIDGGSGSGSAQAGSGGGQQQGSFWQQAQLAALLLERGRHRDALAALQPLLAQQPASPGLLCLQGRCHASAGSRAQVGFLCGLAMLWFKFTALYCTMHRLFFYCCSWLYCAFTVARAWCYGTVHWNTQCLPLLPLLRRR